MEEYVYFDDCVGLLNKKSTKKGILFYPGFFGDKNESSDLFKDFSNILSKKDFQRLDLI